MLLLKLLGALVLWMVIGCVVVYITAFIHIMVAEYKGYDALRWTDDYYEHYKNICGSGTGFRCRMIVGLFIWPAAIIRFLVVDASSVYDNEYYKTEV